MILRPYQKAAFDAIMQHVRASTDSCVLDAATGAGKSYIIAAVAAEIHKISKGRSVLCLAPSKELIEQNREKYLLTGNPASIFSASAGGKCLRHPVVFGTPQSVKNSIERFGDRFAAVIADECHGITPTIKSIIESLKSRSPRLRVIGLTATPYRLGSGYVYQIGQDDASLPEDVAHNPYFKKLVYRIDAMELINSGFLTRPAIGQVSQSYDTSGLIMNKTGNWNAETIDKAFIGKGRLTANIIADIVANSTGRRGVLIFCASIAHAVEALASLPKEISAIVTGGTKKAERERILSAFKEQRIKYIVNVAVLTTGFDAPHVDVIALLRSTESVSLLQQICGRGLRVYPEKRDCLILDYAENIERHCPDGDLFNPIITAHKPTGGDSLSATCPECGYENLFAARPNPSGFAITAQGYFADLNGQLVNDESPIPAHFGRRCAKQYLDSDGHYHQCGYRWAHKVCPECDAENDIAARFCSECKTELVDPNEKLRLDFKRFKSDPYQLQVDKVLDFIAVRHLSMNGNLTLRLEWTTEYRSFTTYHTPKYRSKWSRLFPNLQDVPEQKVLDRWKPPSTVTYRKDKNSKFFEVFAVNQQADEAPA